jgi:DNA repair protein RadA/Sms
MRAGRLGLPGERLFVLTETNLSAALAQAESLSPSLVVIDSIQTVYSESAEQAPGSIVQLRQCTMELMRWSKGTGVPVSCWPRDQGEIAGPRLLSISSTLSCTWKASVQQLPPASRREEPIRLGGRVAY